jgi:hypothetical protein
MMAQCRHELLIARAFAKRHIQRGRLLVRKHHVVPSCQRGNESTLMNMEGPLKEDTSKIG